MDFKSVCSEYDGKEFEDTYRQLEIIANDRATDLNSQSVNFMLNNLDKDASINA